MMHFEDSATDMRLLAAVMGTAIGDALGFPVQFETREKLLSNPVTGMDEDAVFSDDTSLTLCTLASFRENNWRLDVEDIMERFLRWIQEGYMSAENYAFDIGRTTRKALQRYYDGVPLDLCGCSGPGDCGNGSLMRMIPAVFYLDKNRGADVYETVRALSCLTHAHEVCVLGCYLYVTFALRLLYDKREKVSLYREFAAAALPDISRRFSPQAVKIYEPILDAGNLISLSEDDVESSGYIIDTLAAALWVFLTSSSFRECVVKAVALGYDTDTNAAVAGGLAGIYYGYGAIPGEWINNMRNSGLIKAMCSV